MNVKIIYPHAEKKKIQRQDVIHWAKWPFLLAAIACVIVNIAAGPPAWCLISIWSLWMVWSFFISPALVEYNRISLWIRFITSSSILLLIIDTLFPVGWSAAVVPIVDTGGLAVASILFFTDLERQKQNMMPLLLLLFSCLFLSVSGLLGGRMTWEIIAAGALAAAVLAVCIAVLRKGLIRELRKRFHT